MNQDELLELIEKAAVEGWTELDLSFNGLRKLPLEIKQLTSLTVLDLNSNKLTIIPPEIGQLESLTKLYINGNRLINVPSEIGQLANLQTLSLAQQFGKYGIKKLPSEIGLLTNLIFTTVHFLFSAVKFT